MARAITQDMDRPSLHRLHNRNNNRSNTNNEINTKASADADERVAAAAVVEVVDTADIRTRP